MTLILDLFISSSLSSKSCIKFTCVHLDHRGVDISWITGLQLWNIFSHIFKEKNQLMKPGVDLKNPTNTIMIDLSMFVLNSVLITSLHFSSWTAYFHQCKFTLNEYAKTDYALNLNNIFFTMRTEQSRKRNEYEKNINIIIGIDFEIHFFLKPATTTTAEVDYYATQESQSVVECMQVSR